MGGSSKKNNNEIAPNGLTPIDIPASKFFWMIQPWRDGKLATVDGWGRFAEISFIGANKMRVKPLCDFPRIQLDRGLKTWPKAGLIAAQTSDRMHHIAAIDDNKTKSHIPNMTWLHYCLKPVLLDAKEGLVVYPYSYEDKDKLNDHQFIYNYREDRMVDSIQNPGYNIVIRHEINETYVLAGQRSIVDQKRINNDIVDKRLIDKDVFYNWRTKEVIENDLTNALNQNRIIATLGTNYNIHLGKRFLFGDSNITKTKTKVSWDENYSDVKVTPLNYLYPDGKRFYDFIISDDGNWASCFVGGYNGLYGEQLEKRAFFHLDELYPNGMSMPIIAEDYEEYIREYSAFVEHPVHGMCYAMEWEKTNGSRKKQFLRLYRMKDVEEEIKRQLLEKANEISNK